VTGYVAGSSLAIATSSPRRISWPPAGLPASPQRACRCGSPRRSRSCCSTSGTTVAHWLLHRVDFLWELHKVHHSSPTLDWLATFRSHVIEQALRRLIAPVLLIVAGFSTDAVVLAGSLFYAWAAFNHANLRRGCASWSRYW